ncbi:MAG: tRNA dihydrouridine(20/20a) synthase DusA [Gammaproteobacteria bacterium]|nr:tRNA dihydrouridine(20/20a) synthase DusA [Gammaproteobacteria bacterium]
MNRATPHPHRLCVAPMMNCTDRHYRYLARLLSKHSMLYTEMMAAGALVHGDHERLLEFNSSEHPLALQVGGSHVPDMQRCTEYAAELGYDEVNINAGCPSSRVQAGRFGACLMLEPQTVADCVRAMQTVAPIRISVKTRIGVDDHDRYPVLHHFVDTVAAAGCSIFIVHARKAFLSGLSPKQNRSIPPLRYEFVYRLKQDFPDLRIVLNGGLSDEAEILPHLENVDGVMIGREAYENPYFLAHLDAALFHTRLPSRGEVLDAYKGYARRQLDAGVPLATLCRHLSGLFHSMPGARAWRRVLNESTGKKDASLEIICTAERFVAGGLYG